jgi:spore coat protein U-like protein
MITSGCFFIIRTSRNSVMKFKRLKKRCAVLVFLVLLLLLAGTVQAAINCPGTLPSGTQGAAYTYTFTGTNGNGNYPWWSRTSGTLPTGLTLNNYATNSVRLSGTPAAGTYTFTISHQELGADPTCTVTVTINPPLSLTPVNWSRVSPDAIRNLYYTSATTFTASGGMPPYTWSTPTALPAGLSLSSTSGNNIKIIGTTTATTGLKIFRVRVQDANGAAVTYYYMIQIIANGCSFTGASTGSILFDSSGTIDPTSTGPLIGSVTSPQFTCTAGTACTITVNPAGGWQISSGSNTIGYTLGVVPSGTYGAAAVNVFTAGTMTQAQYGNALAGNYANTSAINVTISWSGGAMTASLPVGSVTGTLLNICSVNGSPALNFGTIDAATNAGGATATVVSPTIMCTMGDAISVTNNGGLNFSGTPRMKSGTNYLNYNFNSAGSMTGAGGTTNIGGTGTGNLNLGATISAGVLDNVHAGAYSDTVTLNINY